MSIEVVRFGLQSWRQPSGEADAALETGGEAEPAVLLFDPRMERGARDVIGDRFRRVDAGARAADLLIVRGSRPELRERVEADAMLAERRGERGTLVLCPSELGRAPELHDVSWSPPVDRRPTTEELREAEILCGLNTKEAVYRQAGVHYLMPNTRYHAEAFVRLGDSLNDQIDLVRLSDWLIPRIDQYTALLADNGSMLPLLTTLALRANQIHEFVPQIATLDEYPLTPTAVAELVERLPLDGGERLLCLISVSSSGRVADTLAALDGTETEAVIICETGDGQGGVEHFARLPVKRWEINDEGRCPACKEMHLLAVSPRSYELRTAIKFEPETLDIGHAAECREFWEAVEKAGAISLHVEAKRARGAPSGNRHLAVQIDVAELLSKSKPFRARCLEELAKIAEPSLVLIPEHAASEALRALVLEAFPNLGASQVMLCGVGPELPELPPLLEEVDHVLIVDDTLISGTTLVGMRLAIHDAAVTLDRNVDVSVFVCISRPANSENEKRVRLPVTRPAKKKG